MAHNKQVRAAIRTVAVVEREQPGQTNKRKQGELAEVVHVNAGSVNMLAYGQPPLMIKP
jgi:hypothetical protein